MSSKNDRELLPRRGEKVLDTLRGIPGVGIQDSFRGSVRAGGNVGRLRLEAGGWIRVCFAAAGSPSPEAALEQHGELAGCVRYAGSPRALRLVADTRIDGVEHLPGSLAEIRSAIRRTTSKRGPGQPRGSRREKTAKRQSRDSGRIEMALDGLGWEKTRILPREGGWEVRPRIRGAEIPVFLILSSDHLHLRVTVLRSLPPGHRTRAIVHRALGYNEELRFARLSLREESLIVETRLRSQLIDTLWLTVAIQAVAAAHDHTRTTLAILSEQEAVARCYVQLLDEQPADTEGVPVRC